MTGSASRRRKHRQSRAARRRSSPSAPRVSSVTTLAFDEHQIRSGPGFDLLCKNGWQPGQSLGMPSNSTPVADHNASSARAAPIPIVVKRGRAGVGAVVSQHAQSLPARWHTQPPEHVRHQRAALKHVASVHIFDPLRPRCQYDASHVVPNLKALRKHERTCPANPARFTSSSAAQSQLSRVEHRHVPLSPASFENQFSELALYSSASSSSTSVCSETQSDAAMSDMSSVTSPDEREPSPQFALLGL